MVHAVTACFRRLRQYLEAFDLVGAVRPRPRVRFINCARMHWRSLLLVIPVVLGLTVNTYAADAIVRSADPVADLERLVSLDEAEWAALTVADLGEAWWILHEAGQSARARYGDYVIAVRVQGALGYIDTRRLSAAAIGQPVPYVLSDLYQSHPRGNFSILVSGAAPVHRPLGAPLRWRGFVWEGLEPPQKRIGEVFEAVQVMARADIDFTAATGFGRGLSPAAEQSTVELVAAATSSTPVAPTPTPTPTPQPLKVRTHSTLTQALATPSKRRAAPVTRPSADTRLVERKLTRVTRFNTLLRRRVVYLEALLAGRERGYGINTDATIGSLIEVIMQGKSQPQRNVYLRLKVGEESRVGRIVSASRYPLYKINSAARGSHEILMDLEIRGPDGRTILKSSVPGATPSPTFVRNSPVQFMHVNQNTTLRELGVTEAVYWPVRGSSRKPPSQG